MHTSDFVAIGDTVVDDFIRLKEARVHCDIDTDACTISMRWGDKIPFESSTIISGVGNAANAAVAAKRLGISCALITNIGKDRHGEEVLKAHTNEGLDTSYTTLHEGKTTNYHYVLWYESERTILVKHESYEYDFPRDISPPKTLYLSSLGEQVPFSYYEAIAAFLEEHQDVFFVFQPGTFQMKLGIEKLSRIYKRTNLFVCNKEEAGRILGTEDRDIRTLLTTMKALGPAEVIITDGKKGAHAVTSEGSMWSVPLYPDIREPYERTGAGDAFASTVAAARTLGKTLEESLLWGPINSMSVVQEIGAQKGLLSREKLEEYLQHAPAEYVLKFIEAL